jgi:hypothetical protein
MTQLDIDFINCHIHYCEVCGKRLEHNEGTQFYSQYQRPPWTGCLHYLEESGTIPGGVLMGLDDYAKANGAT